jgi:S1-C subfamily serine protease
MAPALLVLATAVIVLWGTPATLRQISHDRIVHQVKEASLRLNTSSEVSPSSSSFLEQLNQASRDVASFVRPSVVHISAQQNPDPQEFFAGISTGSGWIWSDQGHILTNWHVVSGADRIDVQLHDGTVRPATLVGADPTTDIAVIQIPAGRLVAATRADVREDIDQGSLVFAFGSPMDFRFSMSQGIVSGLGRSVGLFRSRTSLGYENFIQVDAAINPGNSGGPLTNHRGEVIGMNTAIATNDRESEGRFSGIGLAIPLDMIESVAKQVIDNGSVRKGYLGVTVVDQREPIFRWLLPLGFDVNGSGVLISGVGETMADAGLLPGDIILSYDGEQVGNPDGFWSAFEADADQTTSLSIWRPQPDIGQSRSMKVSIPRPASQVESELKLLDAMDQMSSYYRDIGFLRTGVLVVKTMPGRPARRGGLKACDIIYQINGREMNTVDQLRSTISSILPDSVVEIMVWRPEPGTGSGKSITLEIPLAELDNLP